MRVNALVPHTSRLATRQPLPAAACVLPLGAWARQPCALDPPRNAFCLPPRFEQFFKST